MTTARPWEAPIARIAIHQRAYLHVHPPPVATGTAMSQMPRPRKIRNHPGYPDVARTR
jgi:hypothetical protein